MDLISAVIVVCCIVLAYVYVCHVQRQNKDLPPGPWGLPLVGYLPFLSKNAIYELTNLREKYGNVVSLRLGSKLVVLLQDHLAVREAFVKQADVFSGRPEILLFQTVFTDKDIAFNDYGEVWKEQRRLSMRILHDFGFGKSQIEAVILDEAEKLSDKLTLKAQNAEPVEIDDLFFLPVLNVIWGVTAGKRFEDNDEYMLKFKDLIRASTSGAMYEAINYIPFLRHFIPNFKQKFEKFKSISETIQQYLEDEVINHERNFRKNNLSDFIDVYLSEIYSRRSDDGQDQAPYTRDHLVSTLLDLFIGGVDTTDTTLRFSLLHMALNPEIQRKVQKELDGVVAKESYLSYSARALAPYTEATLLEIQRMPIVAPLSIAHKTTKDAKLFGFSIPKSTTVLANLYSVHNDKSVWKNPDRFQPERFLDECGKVTKPKWFMPLSTGARKCLGRNLVQTELPLFFTILMRRFTFETVPTEPVPSMEVIPGGIINVAPFRLIVKPR